MKIDTINLSGKKTSIEVLDKIFSAKINKKLVDFSVTRGDKILSYKCILSILCIPFF